MNQHLRTLFLFLALAVQTAYANHLSSNLVFSARMSGDQENPQVVSDGQGVAVITLDQTQSNIYLNVTFSSLSSAVTGAHIHEGNVGENGPVIYDLSA
ncbi:MAG TPA: CHRD domain-containing protein, partial [Saprospiraceae bacterium]|nr:CHRD domain-containing protein [Saprospiraceae bacterium]